MSAIELYKPLRCSRELARRLGAMGAEMHGLSLMVFVLDTNETLRWPFVYDGQKTNGADK
jgi:hypothetical protein